MRADGAMRPLAGPPAITREAIMVVKTTVSGTHDAVKCWEEGHLVIERLLEPGSTELPICRCGVR
jgi:hypothetical protein